MRQTVAFAKWVFLSLLGCSAEGALTAMVSKWYVAMSSDCTHVFLGMKAIIASPSMRALMTLAERVARSNATVLILGESGSGKEVLARHSSLLRPLGEALGRSQLRRSPGTLD